jgi:hypothetical protein
MAQVVYFHARRQTARKVQAFMKLKALQAKPYAVEFHSEDSNEAPGILYIRHSPTEAIDKQQRLEDEERQRLGVGPDAPIGVAIFKVVRRALIGTQVMGWANWQNENGEEIGGGTPGSELNEDNGAAIIASPEVRARLDAEIAALGERNAERLQAAAKNSAAPLAVN